MFSIFLSKDTREEHQSTHKDNTIWSHSYDEYGWSYAHWCWDTKDK